MRKKVRDVERSFNKREKEKKKEKIKQKKKFK